MPLKTMTQLLLFALFAIPAVISGRTVVPEPKIPFAPRNYVCYRTGSEDAVKVDGILDESAWENALWSDDFVDIEGTRKPKPRFRTRIKMLWDDRHLYIGGRIEDPDVWATLTRRDSIIFYDNDFEVFIDPDGDTHHYFELEINALGTEWDLLLTRPYRDGGIPVTLWDIAGLKTKVSVDGTINRPGDRDEGWTVEIAIPWEAILARSIHREPTSVPKPGECMRINFSRVEYRVDPTKDGYRKTVDPSSGMPFPVDNWVWSPQGVINMHYPEMWGYVWFSGKTAGSGTESYPEKKEESAKWALRRVYYRERARGGIQQPFTDSIAELGMETLPIVGYQWPPEIKHTMNLFEASLKGIDGCEEWTIDQDGLVQRIGRK